MNIIHQFTIFHNNPVSCPVSSQGGSTGVQFVDGINFAISFTFHSLQMQMLMNSLITYQSIPFLPLRAIFQGGVVFDLPFAFLVSYRFFKPNTFFSKAFWLIWFVSSKKSGLCLCRLLKKIRCTLRHFIPFVSVLVT